MSDTFTVSDGYILLPYTVNANTLLQQALANIQAQLPQWTPRESHIEVLLLEQFAQMAAESAAVAANVPLSIFTYFGSLVNILPEAGSPAQAQTTWTMIDAKGYTVPAGTVVGYQLLGNSLFLFQTILAFTVPPGSTSTAPGSVIVQAQVSGAAQNGFGAQGLILVNPTYPFVSSIVSTTTTSGGADPESQAQYLNRLSDDLQLMAPRPILPQDFAALSVNVAGVARAVAIDLLNPGRVVPFASLEINSPLVSAPTASWTNDDVGRTITGTDIPSSPATTLLSVQTSNQATMSQNATATAYDTVTLGDVLDAERCVSVCPVDINGNELSTDIQNDLMEYLEAQREINFLVNIIPPTYTTVDVACIVQCLPTADPGATESAIIANLQSFFSQANWGGGDQSPPVWNPNENDVRFLSVAAVISETDGVDFIVSGSLSIGPDGEGQGAGDIILPGYAPLTMPGTFNITVVTG